MNCSEKASHPRVAQLAAAAWLRSIPGCWVRLEEAVSVQRAANRAAEIRMGRPVAFRPSGHYEATSRGQSVYVRYVGPEGPTAWPAPPPPRNRHFTTTNERTP